MYLLFLCCKKRKCMFKKDLDMWELEESYSTAPPLHSKDKQTWAQRSEVICWEVRSQVAAELRLDSRFSRSMPEVLHYFLKLHLVWFLFRLPRRKSNIHVSRATIRCPIVEPHREEGLLNESRQTGCSWSTASAVPERLLFSWPREILGDS